MNKLQRAVLLAARCGDASGDNIKITCPACNQKTMYYNPQNGGFMCFRNKCNVKGFTKKGTRTTSTNESSFMDSISISDMVSATDVHLPSDYLQCISYPVWYLPSHKRVGFEVHDFSGEKKGYILRSYRGAVPKALTAVQGPCIHVPVPARRHNGSVVIVEDYVSAEKLSSITPAVAILGTYVTHATAECLYTAGIRGIILALDEDAGWKAVKESRRLGRFNCSVELLTKDPKDSTLEELQEIFDGH